MTESTPSPNRMPMIILAYLWILAIVPLLVEKRDAEVQWHAKHGLVLLAAEFILAIAYNIVVGMLVAITGGFGCLFALFSPAITLGILIVHVIAIVKGLQGGRLIIPGVSEYANRF